MTSDLHRIESKNRISLSCILFWQKKNYMGLSASAFLSSKEKPWYFQESPGVLCGTGDLESNQPWGQHPDTWTESSVQVIPRCLNHSVRVICSLPKVEHINILLIFILKNSEESTKTKFLPPTFFSGDRVVVAEGSDFIMGGLSWPGFK